MEVNVLSRFFWALSCLSIIAIRIVITGAATEYLHKIEIRKRRKEQSIIEWFTYSRFREELPNSILLFYYIVICGNILLMIIVFFFSKYDINADKLMMSSIWLNFLWFIYIRIRTTDYKRGGTNFKKWVPKPPNRK